MDEKIKISKEINGKTEYGQKYKVKNLGFEKNGRAVLYGTLIINEKERDFGIDLSYHENSEEPDDPYYFEDDNVEDEFYDAILDFYLNHLNGRSGSKLSKDKDETLHLDQVIKII